MKIPIRILAPTIIAIALVLAIGVFFLWQVKNSVALIGRNSEPVSNNAGATSIPLLGRPSVEEETEALAALRQGEVLLLQGDSANAQEKIEESISLGGGTIAMRKLLEVQLLRRNYQDALKTINDLEDDGLGSADVLFLKGLIALKQGDMQNAQTLFEQTTPLMRSYGNALVSIAIGKHDEAKQMLQTVAQGNEPALRQQAQLLLDAYNEFGLFEEGQDIHLITLLSRALAQINDCDIALGLLTHVVAAKDTYRDAWIVKGYCEFSTEQFDEALISLERAYTIDPEKAETQYFLARTYFMLGDPQNAVTFLQYALINGFTPERDARLLLAHYALELGDSGLALEQYLALTEKPTSDATDFEKYVSLAMTVPNEQENAYQVARIALSRWPEDTGVLLITAKSAIAANRQSEAMQYLQTILVRDPENQEAKDILATLQL